MKLRTQLALAALAATSTHVNAEVLVLPVAYECREDGGCVVTHSAYDWHESSESSKPVGPLGKAPPRIHVGRYSVFVVYTKEEVDALQTKTDKRIEEVEQNVVASLASLKSDQVLADVLLNLEDRVAQLEAAEQRMRQLEERIRLLESLGD